MCSCYFTKGVDGNISFNKECLLFHTFETYNCHTRTDVRTGNGLAQWKRNLPHTKVPLVQGMSSIGSGINLHSIISMHLTLPITLHKPTEERLWCPQQLQDHPCSEGGWLRGGVTVCELPSEHPTDSLLEQIPVPAPKTATFRSISDCCHADTNKSTHLTFLSQAWGESRPLVCVCASYGDFPVVYIVYIVGITRGRVRSRICDSYARQRHNKAATARNVATRLPLHLETGRA